MPLKWEVKSFKFPPSYPKVEKNTYMVLSQWKRIHLPTQEMRVQSLGQEDPLEKEMATTSVFLPAESHGQRSLVGYSPWGCKESDMTE